MTLLALLLVLLVLQIASLRNSRKLTRTLEKQFQSQGKFNDVTNTRLARLESR